MENYFIEPFRVYLIFSSLIWSITSFSHLQCVGGNACFHLKRISRLASRVVNAITEHIPLLRAGSSGFTPNMAMTGLGSTLTPLILVKHWKIFFKNISRTGQSLNIWIRVHGESLHLLQAGSTSGSILASLELAI